MKPLKSQHITDHINKFVSVIILSAFYIPRIFFLFIFTHRFIVDGFFHPNQIHTFTFYCRELTMTITGRFLTFVDDSTYEKIKKTILMQYTLVDLKILYLFMFGNNRFFSYIQTSNSFNIYFLDLNDIIRFL